MLICDSYLVVLQLIKYTAVWHLSSTLRFCRLDKMLLFSKKKRIYEGDKLSGWLKVKGCHLKLASVVYTFDTIDNRLSSLIALYNGFIRSDSVISSESCLNIWNSNFSISQRFGTFHWLQNRSNCLDHSEHSWINSLSFFSSFLFCCFITDLRCWTRVSLKYLIYCYFPHFYFVDVFLLTS